MRHFALAILVGAAMASPASAQTNPASAGAADPAPAEAASPDAPASATKPAMTPAMTKDGKPMAKEVRAACRETAKGNGLKGDELHKAVSECLIKQRPDLAAKEQCRMDGRAKGLRKDGLKAFVQDCAKAKG